MEPYPLTLNSLRGFLIVSSPPSELLHKAQGDINRLANLLVDNGYAKLILESYAKCQHHQLGLAEGGDAL